MKSMVDCVPVARRSRSFATKSCGTAYYRRTRRATAIRFSPVRSSRASMAELSLSMPTSDRMSTVTSIYFLATSWQLADGGWNCEPERGPKRKSFHTFHPRWWGVTSHVVP